MPQRKRRLAGLGNCFRGVGFAVPLLGASISHHGRFRVQGVRDADLWRFRVQGVRDADLWRGACIFGAKGVHDNVCCFGIHEKVELGRKRRVPCKRGRIQARPGDMRS